MSKRLNNLFFIVGIVAVVVMLVTFDVSFAELWAAISRAGYWLLAIMALWLLLYVLNACAWRMIIRGSGPCTVSFPRLLQITITGFALNYATPIGFLGGEPYRVLAMKEHIGVRRATSSVVLFAMMHIYSHFWFWLTGIALYVVMAAMGMVPISVGLAMALGMMLVFCGVGIYVFVRGYRHGMVLALVRWVAGLPGLGRWGKSFLSRHADDLLAIDGQIRELRSQRGRSFYGSLALEYVGRVLQCLEVMFVLRLLGEGGACACAMWLLFCQSVLVLAFTSLFANVLGFLPMQLGGREGGFAMSVAYLGLSAEVGMMVGIISRVRELAWIVVGVVAMKLSMVRVGGLYAKSADTEEWIDTVWTRPLGYLWARLFARMGVHPNVVTVMSMVLGASAALFFAHGSYRTEGMAGLWLNVAGVLLLSWANVYDSADGQLARMTGKCTRLGRILDGAASEVWFVPIYLALVWRSVGGAAALQAFGAREWCEAAALLCVALYSGFVCHSGQCALADYYRQAHLYFLKGEAGSELDSADQQQRLYDATPWRSGWLWKAFLKTYVEYTRRQERRTPQFQRLMASLRRAYGSAACAPREFRERFRRMSLPLMKWTNVLTFNTRALVLYAACLADVPLLYFAFEIVVLGALCRYMRWRHESMCAKLNFEF